MVAMSVLPYGCTIRSLKKQLEKKLDRNYSRMLCDVLNTFWKQHPTKQQLYGQLPPILETIQVWQTKHAGHYWRSKDKFINNIILWTTTYWHTRVGQPTRTYTNKLSADTGYILEDLPRTMVDKDRWWKRVKGTHAIRMTWLWNENWQNEKEEKHFAKSDWYVLIVV